jgi:transposase-like protein
MNSLHRHYTCASCGERFTLNEALRAENPFGGGIMLRGCPACRKVLLEDVSTSAMRLVCSHDGCKAQPIGEIQGGYWCPSHYPVS